jgi:hypothetical protein
MRVCWSDITATKVEGSSFPSQAMAMLVSGKPFLQCYVLYRSEMSIPYRLLLIELSKLFVCGSGSEIKSRPSEKKDTVRYQAGLQNLHGSVNM